jgi:uncharacterized protein YegP (UPF0339 family)
MLFGIFVLAMLVGLYAASIEPAAAQGKKKATGAGTIEINEGKDGKFRFNVRDANGKLLAQSSLAGFASVKDAEAGIDTLKEVISTAKVVTNPKKKAKEKE